MTHEPFFFEFESFSKSLIRALTLSLRLLVLLTYFSCYTFKTNSQVFCVDMFAEGGTSEQWRRWEFSEVIKTFLLLQILCSSIKAMTVTAVRHTSLFFMGWGNSSKENSSDDGQTLRIIKLMSSLACLCHMRSVLVKKHLLISSLSLWEHLKFKFFDWMLIWIMQFL